MASTYTPLYTIPFAFSNSDITSAFIRGIYYFNPNKPFNMSDIDNFF